MFSFGWFSSGRGQGSIDLLTTAHREISSGFIPGRIAYVFTDRGPGESPAADRFQAVVKSLNLPLLTCSSLHLRQQIRQKAGDVEAARQEFDGRIFKLLAGYDANVVVLAGYMLVLSPHLCEQLLCLNLHPAVPGGPKGTWRQVMWQLMAEEAGEAGAMMHLVTPELDKGPPVTYCRFSLQGSDFAPFWQAFKEKRRIFSLKEIRAKEGDQEPLFSYLRSQELRREFPLILLTLKNLASGRLTLTFQGVREAGRLVADGFDISSEVEAYLYSASLK